LILEAKKKQRRSLVDHTPLAQVKALPKREQREWAKDELKRSSLHWANSASLMVHRDLFPHNKQHKGLRDKHHIAVEPLPAKGKAGKVDTFGMPELRGAWSGGMVPQNVKEINNELRSHRPCGMLCMHRAVSAARSMLPTSDGALSGVTDDGILPRMPVN
jgi:hypothetical protein